MLGSLALALLLLYPRIMLLDEGLWGPEDPWTHRDFLGAWWLIWASARPGDALGMLNWPDGTLPLQHHIPNPFDAWLLGPLIWGERAWIAWNGMQLLHHLGNIAAAALLARAAGAGGWSTLGGMALLAASPVMLHEIAGGRTLSGAVWPGLLALALLLRGRGGLAGLLIGLQGLFYLYTGALFGLVALILRPAAGLLLSLLLLLPYAAWLWPLLGGLHGKAPPAGFTELPVSGLLGLDPVPERFRLHPLLLPLGLLGILIRRRWRLAGVLGLVLLVALGPFPGWGLDDRLYTSPLAWVQWAIPGLGRMHHPVRAALLLAPLLGVGLALLLERLPRVLVLLPILLALSSRATLQQATAWGAPSSPPGVDAARFLRENASAIVDLTGAGDAALGLQPLHERPMLEGLRRTVVPAHGRGPVSARLRARVDGWLEGEQQPGLAGDLARAGFSHVLVVEREGPVELRALDLRALEADLGPPLAPGIYALPGP